MYPSPWQPDRYEVNRSNPFFVCWSNKDRTTATAIMSILQYLGAYPLTRKRWWFVGRGCTWPNNEASVKTDKISLLLGHSDMRNPPLPGEISSGVKLNDKETLAVPTAQINPQWRSEPHREEKRGLIWIANRQLVFLCLQINKINKNAASTAQDRLKKLHTSPHSCYFFCLSKTPIIIYFIVHVFKWMLLTLTVWQEKTI